MTTIKQYSAEFEAKVAVLAIHADVTVAKLATRSARICSRRAIPLGNE
jgi:hypothetical protein